MTIGNLPASDLEFGKPGQLGLVIRLNPKTGEWSFDQLTWGFLPHDTQDTVSCPRPIRARAETVTFHPMFVDAFQRRRAIIPANEYFQRATKGEVGTRWALARVDRRPMAWAGLWEGYRAPNGAITRTYCVVTVETSSDMASIHDRMPLVLEDADLPLWLSEEPGDPTALLRPPPGGILKCRALGQGSRGRR
jgi:putative SOS response-associated peptidase YedK